MSAKVSRKLVPNVLPVLLNFTFCTLFSGPSKIMISNYQQTEACVVGSCDLRRNQLFSGGGGGGEGGGVGGGNTSSRPCTNVRSASRNQGTRLFVVTQHRVLACQTNQPTKTNRTEKTNRFFSSFLKCQSALSMKVMQLLGVLNTSKRQYYERKHVK